MSNFCSAVILSHYRLLFFFFLFAEVGLDKTVLHPSAAYPSGLFVPNPFPFSVVDAGAGEKSFSPPATCERWMNRSACLESRPPGGQGGRRVGCSSVKPPLCFVSCDKSEWLQCWAWSQRELEGQQGYQWQTALLSHYWEDWMVVGSSRDRWRGVFLGF